MLRTSAAIAENLQAIQLRIAEAAAHSGRQPEAITLVGASKTRSAEEVAQAVRAGLRHIGENRVQEAAEKFPHLQNLLGAESQMPTLHMLGHLQTNKAGAAAQLFTCIDSVDSVHLARALSRRVGDAEEALAIRLEVYVGDDARRPGIRPEHLDEVVGQILEVPRLRVEGLMTIAPLGVDARAAFRKVRDLKVQLSKTFPRVHFGVLSMGMSEDFSVAIEEGATEVRIGTALFGSRMPTR